MGSAPPRAHEFANRDARSNDIEFLRWRRFGIADRGNLEIETVLRKRRRGR
jgi:hypothetical protein